jgi:hypothetical protein
MPSLNSRLERLERSWPANDVPRVGRPGPRPGFWGELAQLLRESPYLDRVLDETLRLPQHISAEEYLTGLEDAP